MSTLAHILAVFTHRVGDELEVAAAANDLVIQLGDVADFSDGPGVLAVEGTGNPAIDGTVLNYLSSDDDLGTVRLQDPLPWALPRDTDIYIHPPSYQKVAQVEIDAREGPDDATVPQSLWDRIPDGVRDESEQEVVTLFKDGGEWYVKEVEDQEPTIEGSYVLPPVDLWGATPLETHNAAVQAIEADILSVEQQVASGDTANANAIDQAVSDFTAGLATKSKHTLSPNQPGTTANNAGDVWEQHKTNDATKIIARFRGQGGTSWLPMNLDATYIPLLDIGSGTFGDLSGARIVTKSLAVDKLLVSDLTDYVRDPSFDGIGTWTLPTGVTITSDSPRAGDTNNRHARFATNGGTQTMLEPRFPVTPGDSFRLDALIRRAGTAQTSGTLILRFYFYDKDGVAGVPWTTTAPPGAAVANGRLFYYQQQVSPSTLTATWVPLEVEALVPAGAAEGQVQVISASVPAGGFYDVDDVHCRKRFGGSLILDGTLLARHVTADLVEGLLVTGRVLQTNSQAARGIKISTSGLVGYDQSGVARTVIDPTTGLISAEGTVQAISGNTYAKLTAATNAFESGQNWAQLLLGILSGWKEGAVWGAYTGDAGGNYGNLRLSAPYPTGLANGFVETAWIDMRTRSDGLSRINMRSDEFIASAGTFELGSTNGSSVDFNILGSNLWQLQQATGDNRLAVSLNTLNTVEVRARNKQGASKLLVLDGQNVYVQMSGAGADGRIGFLADLTGAPWTGRNDGNAGITWSSGETRSRNYSGTLVPHRASSFPTGSDAGWKRDVRELTGALATVEAVPAEVWTWDDHGHRQGKPGLGFLAQKVKPHVPEAVLGVALSDGGDGLGVDAMPMIGVLWAAQREHLSKTNRLSQRVSDLEQKILSLNLKGTTR